MNRREIKLHVLTMLENNNPDEIRTSFKKFPHHLIINPLFIALCSPLEHVRWNAVSCFGSIMQRLAKEKIDDARVIMNRFLWSLNDESGGIGWGAPESMAEIMCHSSRLRLQYLHMLISYLQRDGDLPFQDGNYLELPMLQRGLLWGIARLCQLHRDEMINQHIVDDLVVYLRSHDLTVVGLAIWCLGFLGVESTRRELTVFEGESTEIRIYRNNLIEEVSIAKLTGEALRTMDVNVYMKVLS